MLSLESWPWLESSLNVHTNRHCEPYMCSVLLLFYRSWFQLSQLRFFKRFTFCCCSVSCPIMVLGSQLKCTGIPVMLFWNKGGSLISFQFQQATILLTVAMVIFWVISVISLWAWFSKTPGFKHLFAVLLHETSCEVTYDTLCWSRFKVDWYSCIWLSHHVY